MRLPFGLLLACAMGLALTSCKPPRDLTKDIRYRYETVVNFGADGHSERFRRWGWSDTEKNFTWTVGTSSKLQLQIPPTNRPLGLRMRLAANFKEPELPIQPVLVFVNGKQLAEWHVALAEHFRVVIPRELLRSDRLLEIKLNMPRATSPRLLGLKDDPRILGVSCYEFEITRAMNILDIWPDAAAGIVDNAK